MNEPQFSILGHSNASLSLVLDGLLSSIRGEIHVEIISNIPVDDDTPYLPENSRLFVVEQSTESWSGNCRNAVLGVLQPNSKAAVVEHFRERHGVAGESYFRLIHPSSVVSESVQIQPGVFVGPGAILAPFAELDEMVSVNRNATIGHHTRIGAFSTLNPGCNVGGQSSIGRNVLVGMGASIFERVEVGDNCIIGAGAVVTKSLPPNVMAMGIPARVVRPV